MTQPIGTKYPTNIPSLSDNADIQTALRVYHYGQATEPSNLLANSIAGHLSNLENTKVDTVPTEIVAGAGNDLNTKVVTGYYSVRTNATAAAGINYPAAAAGVLHVINDGSIIYQIYISNVPRMYWRSKFGSSASWLAWKEVADTTHIPTSVSTDIDNLEAAVATKQALITGAASTIADANLDTEKVLVSDSSGKVRASASVTVTELGNIDGTTGKVPSLAGTVGGDGTSKKIFIQETQPTGTSPGDLWFW